MVDEAGLPPLPDPREIVGPRPRARVLLLGTFHFTANSDYLRHEHPWDALSEQHQAEIAEVVECLARFRPTKVALEFPAERDEELNGRYRAYRDGTYALTANERDQLGFRLAARLGHDRVYAIDAWGREYDPWEQVEEHARRLGRRHLFDTPWLERMAELFRHHDLLRTRIPLRRFLVYINSEEHLRLSHGAYLDLLRTGIRGDYVLVDHVSGWWYNRNLRIFHNLQAITETPDDRILVIIGAGHVPLLRHAVQTSPDHELEEVAAYLA